MRLQHALGNEFWTTFDNCISFLSSDSTLQTWPAVGGLATTVDVLQVERNLASGAKNLFMPHELVAEQVSCLTYLAESLHLA